MNILISGIHGFIGSHLKKTYETKKNLVYGIPRELLQNVGDLKLFLYDRKPDIILHLSAEGNHSMQISEIGIIATNYIGTWNLLQASKDISYKVFINCSTSSIYGHQTEPMSEDTPPKPDTFYAATKAGAMYLARAYAKQYDKPIVSIVPFSVFGPGEADFRFIPTACKYLMQGGRMPFVGWPTHDWIYIDNLIDGIMTVVDNVKKLKGEWINIGMGESWTNNAVLRQLQEISGRRLQRIETYKEQPHHSKEWVANNEKLISLGWRPQVTFEEGLKRTWEYYSKKYTEAKDNKNPGKML